MLPEGRATDAVAAPSVLVIGCGALARELLDVADRHGLSRLRVECLPAVFHNTPEKIPGAVRARLEQATGFESVYVAYGDCGTGGRLDAVLDEFGVERLPGAHCYEFFAGSSLFLEMHEEELGTLYLTDYLARHFDRIIWHGLGLDRWPDLADDYFGNYHRLVYLAQTESVDLEARAIEAADRLGLRYEKRQVGYGEMEAELVRIGSGGVR